MILIRGMAAGVVVAATTVGLASPAWADELSGTYHVNYGDGSLRIWTITACGPECLNIAQKEPTTGGSMLNGQALLAGNQWTMVVPMPDAIICDGGKFPGTQTWAWDATTLAGTSTKPHGTECGRPPGVYTYDFTLTKAPGTETPESPDPMPDDDTPSTTGG